MPLHFACLAGDAAAVRWLLRHGAELDAKDNKGCTSLFRAAQWGHTACVQALLEGGAE